MCIDSVESAMASAEGGADRVEFCANLLEGGTTPSLGAIRETRRRVAIDVAVMVRPRGGDFCYSDEEFAVMREDVKIIREEGVDVIVFGLLRPDGTVDEERSKELVDLARPAQVTFHRAFDMTKDPFASLESLCALGVDRLLTSGQEASVLEGLDLITELVTKAGDRLVVMPGCGITLKNLKRIVSATGAREFHVAAPSLEVSRMTFRNPDVFMGTALRSDEYARPLTTAETVQALARNLRP